ncbi:MAG: hypothetical protein WBO10_00415 [Pyrinomonadaceae bacterium]
MNSNKLTTAIVLSFIAIFSVSAYGQNRRVLATAEQTSGDRFTSVANTPRGANVLSVNRPSLETLSAIDKGLTDLFAVARKNRYRKRLNYRDYTIYIGKADRTYDSDGNYSPAIAIGSAQYAGTIFDKGGYIYVAGMVLSNEPCAFLVPEHTKNFALLSDYVRYEGEHLVLYHNDRRRYSATADHSKGGSHPILQ